MRKLKSVIAQLPVIGYIFRFIAGLVFLPRHLTSYRNTFAKQEKTIQSLQEISIRSNRQLVDLSDHQAKLEKEIRDLRKELGRSSGR